VLELLFAAAMSQAVANGDCPTGLFKSPEGTEQAVITVRPSGEFRYMFADGRRGKFGAADSPLTCAGGRLVGNKGQASWAPVNVRLTDVSFKSHGSQLSGTLLEPPGPGPHPLVVFVHGSERTSPMSGTYPLVLAAHGISVFAYDKRGTGKSEGEYTQNFELLADDAAAAMAEARRVAAGRFGRIGYFGGSQGGWVAPLAATRSNADFVAVGFGLMASPIDEDREQVLSEMRAKGYGEPDLAQAREVAAATSRLLTSGFTAGFEQLADVKRRYGAKPWFSQIEGEYTGDILREREVDLRRVGPALFDNLELIWDYDSRPVLAKLQVPQLWILAEADREAPPATTLAALEALRRKGSNLAIYSFPGTDHGMVEFTEAADGTRNYGRITDGYFRLLSDWIKGSPVGSYGRAVKR
jgi:pimeloyl-ACP methyl ester carboxylesterase